MEKNNEIKWKAEKVIGGNAEALRALRELIIFPHLYIQEAQKLGLKWPSGLLLHGPPGTGKTSLVRAVVHECGAHLTVISPHSVNRAHAGESEKILREAFAEASRHAKLGKPAVLFIDEIDSICPRRDSRREQNIRVTSQLFMLMDSQNSLSTFMPKVVVASTNRLDIGSHSSYQIVSFSIHMIMLGYDFKFSDLFDSFFSCVNRSYPILVFIISTSCNYFSDLIQ